MQDSTETHLYAARGVARSKTGHTREPTNENPPKGTANAMSRSAAKRPTSIRIFLADGTPDGLRVVEKSNWTGRALMTSRAQYPEIRSREELKGPGVYLLRGRATGRGFASRIYLGEADVVRTRVDDHYRNKEFWEDLILFSSKDANLNKAHVRYLEARLLSIAHEAKQAELDNTNKQQIPLLSEAEQADAEAFLDDMLVIYPVLGVRAFDQASEASTTVAGTRRPLLHLTGKLAKARGRDTPEGFIVYQGATARAEVVPSIHTFLIDLRDKLVQEGVFERSREHLLLTQDYPFNSPSTAAGVLLGRNSNGRLKWKTSEGRTLRELQEAEVADPSDSEPPNS